jgi:hypothetical protein
MGLNYSIKFDYINYGHSKGQKVNRIDSQPFKWQFEGSNPIWLKNLMQCLNIFVKEYKIIYRFSNLNII